LLAEERRVGDGCEEGCEDADFEGEVREVDLCELRHVLCLEGLFSVRILWGGFDVWTVYYALLLLLFCSSSATLLLFFCFSTLILYVQYEIFFSRYME